MSDSIDRLKNLLKERGYSLTEARKVVFHALQNREPQSMSEVIMNCQGQVDRASVYRTISLFEALGVIHKLQIGWKYKIELTDIFHHHHHHMSCIQCGNVTTLPEDIQLERRFRRIARQYSFTMQTHQLEIRGLCPRCSQNLKDLG